jgi:hypothetical protein
MKLFNCLQEITASAEMTIFVIAEHYSVIAAKAASSNVTLRK